MVIMVVFVEETEGNLFRFFSLSWCSHEHVKKTLATAGVESLG